MKKRIICTAVLMVLTAIGCSSDKQSFEGRLKIEAKACNNSGGIFHADVANGGSTCECCFGEDCETGTSTECYDSWVCDAANYTCKECETSSTKCENGKFFICMNNGWHEQQDVNNNCAEINVDEFCETNKCVVGNEEIEIVSKNEYDNILNNGNCAEDNIKCVENTESVKGKLTCADKIIAECENGCDVSGKKCNPYKLDGLNNNIMCKIDDANNSRCGILNNSSTASAPTYIQRVCEAGVWRDRLCEGKTCSADARTCGCIVGDQKCVGSFITRDKQDKGKIYKCNALGQWDEEESCPNGCDDDSCKCPSGCNGNCTEDGKCSGSCNCPHGCNDNGSCKCLECSDGQVCNSITGNCETSQPSEACTSDLNGYIWVELNLSDETDTVNINKLFQCEGEKWNEITTIDETEKNIIDSLNGSCKDEYKVTLKCSSDELYSYKCISTNELMYKKCDTGCNTNTNKCKDISDKCSGNGDNIIKVLETGSAPELSGATDECKVCVGKKEASIIAKPGTTCENIFNDTGVSLTAITAISDVDISGCYKIDGDKDDMIIQIKETDSNGDNRQFSINVYNENGNACGDNPEQFSCDSNEEGYYWVKDNGNDIYQCKEGYWSKLQSSPMNIVLDIIDKCSSNGTIKDRFICENSIKTLYFCSKDGSVKFKECECFKETANTQAACRQSVNFNCSENGAYQCTTEGVQQCQKGVWKTIVTETRPVLYFHNSSYMKDDISVDSIHVFSCYDDKRYEVSADIYDDNLKSIDKFINIINGVVYNSINNKCNNAKCSVEQIVMHDNVTEYNEYVCFDDVYNLNDSMSIKNINHPMLFFTTHKGLPDGSNYVNVFYCPANYKCNSDHTDCCDKNNTSCLEK